MITSVDQLSDDDVREVTAYCAAHPGADVFDAITIALDKQVWVPTNLSKFLEAFATRMLTVAGETDPTESDSDS